MISLMDFAKDTAGPRPVIGVSGRTEKDPHPSDVIYSSYTQAIFGGGGLPVILPVTRTAAVAHLIARLDGLVLSGGEDVNPLYYGQPPHAKLARIHTARDEWELILARACLEAGKPLFGICRGLQVLQVALGGELYQDLSSQRPESLGHTQMHARTSPIHEVEIKGNTLLSRLLERAGTIQVNSIHHQAIVQAPPGYIVSAVAPDGVIEGLEAADGRPVFGVQWHPELMDCALQRTLFANFVSLAAGTP